MKRAKRYGRWQGFALLFGLLLTVSLSPLLAQNNGYTPGDTLSIRMKALWQPANNSIALRFAPLNYHSWKYAHEFGLSLVRYGYKRDGILLDPNEVEATKRQFNINALNRQDLEAIMAQQTPDGSGRNWGIAHASYYAPTFEANTIGSTDEVDIITAHSIEKERENRFGFCLLAADQDFELSKAIGLGYVDNDAIENNLEYIYVLNFAGSPDTLGLINTEEIVYINFEMNSDDNNLLRSIGKPTGIGGDKSAFITWDVEAVANQYVSYSIERAGANGIFQRLNTFPIINTSDTEPYIYHYADVLPENNIWYSYRVVGRSVFGDDGPLSDTIRVKGIPKPIEQTPYILAADLLNSSSVELKWEFEASFNSKINGFEVWRSATHDGSPTLLTSIPLISSVRNFIDIMPLPTNYYVVVALDKNGYRLSSLPKLAQLKDETPPNIPEGLHGTVDAKGNATLGWTANTDLDLQGYRVFSCDQIDGEYAEITGYWIPNNQFRFKLEPRSLHEVIYLKVAALDIRENQSELSAPYPLYLVDIVPPVPAVITDIQATAQGVLLNFEPSSSRDVEVHRIERKEVSEPSWQVVKTISKQEMLQNPVKSYLDITAKTLENYQYQIIAVDDAGLTSRTPIRKIQALGEGIRPSVENFEVTLDAFISQHNGTSPLPLKSGNGYKVAKLRWTYDGKHRNVEQFWVYRSIIDAETNAPIRVLWKTFTPAMALETSKTETQVIEGPNGIGTVNKIKNFFMVEDDDVHLIREQIPQNLEYQVMVRFDDGTVSELSDKKHP